jgi:putative ABC transport system ATP-binding protein
MSDSYIQTINVSKVYDEKTFALSDVNISLSEGQWTTIIGPSGSGKTTLLNLIGCLDKPTEGDVIINETNISKLSNNALTKFRRSNIGLIFQQHYLIPYLTTLENVMLAMFYQGSVNQSYAVRILRKVGMEHRLESLPSNLSGGEKARVCIARALINKPRILVADEPTGNLDQKNGEIVLNLIRELHNDGHTILLVTHNNEIPKMGDKILKIVDGKVSNGSKGE